MEKSGFDPNTDPYAGMKGIGRSKVGNFARVGRLFPVIDGA